MLRFFRNIRQKLLENGNLRNYFWYAMGEILLVMIGIILALQVNNWNEERKTKNTIDQILTEVQEDLYNDIVELSLALDWHNKMDTISTRIIEDRLNLEEDPNLNIQDVLNSGLGYYDIIISDRSFQLLSEYKDRISAEYRDLMKRLNSIYVEDQSYLNTVQEEIIDFTNQYSGYLHQTQEWYIRDKSWPSPEAINYFKTDAYHKRQLSNYRQSLREMIKYGTRMLDKSVANYMIIRYLLNDRSELPKFLANYGMTGDPIQGDYDGIFVYTDEQGNTERARINTKYELLFWENLDDRAAFYFSEILLTEITPDSLAVAGFTAYTVSIERNENGEPIDIQSFYNSEPTTNYVLQKE